MIAAPDCPAGAWNNPKSKQAILALHDHLIDQHEIDPEQVSLVGYSAGAWGIWYLLLDSAGRFASAITFACLPVMEPTDRLEDNFPKSIELITSHLNEWVKKFPPIPIYWIQCRNDELFPYDKAKLAYEALVKDEREITLTTLHSVGHFDGEGYKEALYNSAPWLVETWKS
jgi:predicted esterase